MTRAGIRNPLLVEITERSSTRAMPLYVNAFINCGGVLPPPASRTCPEDLVATGVVTQRRRDGGSEASPARLRLRMNSNCLPAARCIRATLFGKIDDLQFPSLRVRTLIRKMRAVGAFGGD